MPSPASVLAPTAASPGMTQRLANWDAGALTDPAGAAVGVGACGLVTGRPGGAGVDVADGAARTTRVAEAPMFPPPQRPVMS